MTINTATAQWQGDLKTGKGDFTLNGGMKGQFSFHSRFETGQGTNPEELIAGAQASCFSMAFSNQLAGAGFTPISVRTQATVTLGKTENGPGITQIALACEADVPNISQAKFDELAQAAKTGCPISKALAAVPEITLQANLKKAAA